MQRLTIHLLLITMLAQALGETETSSNSQMSSTDYVYANYALQYLGLGDYSQQQSTSSPNNQAVYTVPDQQGYVKYITYTSDGSNTYQVTVRVKPGTYPVIWSTPVQSIPNAADTKNNNEKGTDGDSGDGHSSEDAAPMTLPPHHEGHQLLDVTTCRNEIHNDVSTEQPETSESHDGNTSGEDGHKDTSIGVVPEGNQQENLIPNSGMRGSLAHYFPGIYGPMSFYPVAYNPFTGQRKYIAQPVGALTNGQLPSISANMQGEKAGQAPITTLKPQLISSTMGPSSIPVGIPPSSMPMRVQPIPYMYPYMTYHSKNSGMVYQAPAQQMGAGPPHVVRWVQAQPATRFQAAYPSQGYMSYQPAILTLQSSMSSSAGQNAPPLPPLSSTKHAPDNAPQQ